MQHAPANLGDYIIVESGGPRTAEIAVVGEALGQTEERRRIPFIGPSGTLLNTWMEKAGFKRPSVFITNVVCRRPRNDDLANVPKDELAAWKVCLHERLAEMPNLRCIVPVGNLALQTLTGYSGITKWRGSIVPCKRYPLVIPCIHPAAIMRQPFYEPHCQRDWHFIARVLRGEWQEPQFNSTIHGYDKGFERELRKLQNAASDESTVMSIDIETDPRKGIVTCVGFAVDGKHGYTLPTLLEDYVGDEQELAIAWDIIRKLCMTPCQKVMQNGFYDYFWLARKHKIRVANYRWDLAAMHRTLQVNDDHDLAYMAQQAFDICNWKDERKSEDRERQLRYNAKDNAIQRKLWRHFYNRLRAENRLDFYMMAYEDLFAPLLDMCLRGTHFDDVARAAAEAAYAQEARDLHTELSAIHGKPLIVKTGLSTQRVSDFLYKTLNLPKRTYRGKVTTDANAVRSLMQSYSTRNPKGAPAGVNVRDTLGKFLRLRTCLKAASTFLSEDLVDSDGRVRCEYKLVPETLRLSSGKNPLGTGTNLQNQPPIVRPFYLPNEGCVFLKIDLSEVESRIVAALSGDRELISMARRHPTEFDGHKYRASRIFEIPEERVDKAQRGIGKRVTHARNYGMQAKRLLETLLKDGHVRTLPECERWLTIYGAQFPGIDAWQALVRREVMMTRKLTNSWGAEIRFEHERLDDELYRRAYAWRPQGEAGMLMNQRGIVPCWYWLRENGKRGEQLHLQVHDELVASIRPERAYTLAKYLVEILERPRVYDGVEMPIPCSVTLSTAWAGGTEWKRLPTKDEFTTEALRLARS